MPPDRALAYEQVSWPGFSRTFEAQRKISINTEASAVGAEVNGQDLGKLGGSGEVLTRNLRWSSPKVKARRGTVWGTRMVRQGPPREPQDPIKRLGKFGAPSWTPWTAPAARPPSRR